MKILQCRQMGQVSSLKCYDCFSHRMSGVSYPSRVLCKQQNISEEVSLSEELDQTEIPLEKVA